MEAITIQLYLFGMFMVIVLIGSALAWVSDAIESWWEKQ